MSLPKPLSLLLALALAATCSLQVFAQDIRYVSDVHYVPLRSGAGGDYRVIHRGLPSGTQVRVARTSRDKAWAEVTTPEGKNGWIRTQYLMREQPARVQLDAAVARAEELGRASAEAGEQLNQLMAERDQLRQQLAAATAELESASQELASIRKLSGNAIQLDTDNRRLAEEAELLRSGVEMLEAENLRLQDKIENEDFINGALAVLLGVIITLVVPRLWPKRRAGSSWA